MIIVTGGAGFIGSNLVAGLQEKGVEDIVICDWLGDDDKWRNIAKRELRDFIKPDALFDYINKYKDQLDCIFHLGAISSTTETDADLIVERNFTLSRMIWRWCVENDKRFIYASSAATYGDGNQGFDDDASPEGLSQLRPLNGYGWSKHLFDRRVARLVQNKADGKDEKMPKQWAGLKFFNVYGPNEYHKGDQMSVCCKLYPHVTNGAAAKLFKSHHDGYKDGGQLRDFVYVKDCVDVMLWLYDNPDVNGLYNVGTGEARSFFDLAMAVFKAADIEPRVQFIDMPQELRGKYQYFTEANVKKLRDAGYDKPFTSLEDGVNDYIQNFMAKDDQYL
jgi:ADP-L-glycero-D-manno-heptose 6-epimerase